MKDMVTREEKRYNTGMKQRVKLLLDRLAELLRFQRPGTAEKLIEASKKEEQQARSAH